MSETAQIVAALMPALPADLDRLVRIPSIAFPGFPREPQIEAHDLVAGLFRDAGVENVEALALPDTAPVITGDEALPLMAYFPLVVVFVRRYDKEAGIGTVISPMLPYVIVLMIAWTAFFVAWYVRGKRGERRAGEGRGRLVAAGCVVVVPEIRMKSTHPPRAG